MPRAFAATALLVLSLPASAGGLAGISAGELLRPGELRAIPGSGALLSAALREEGEPGEAELVLSLDGGETFALRVSPEGRASSEDLLFRVPNLPASRAVLGLRVGRDGEEEAVVAVSALFEIPFSLAGPPEALGRVREESATREAGGRAGSRLPIAGIAGRAPGLSPGGEPAEAEDDADPGIDSSPPESRSFLEPSSPPHPEPGGGPEAAPLSASLPKRE